MIARHNSNCTREDMKTFTGKLGDDMVICRTCKRVTRAETELFTAVSSSPEAELFNALDSFTEPEPCTAVQGSPVIGRFVCPAHGTPVDSRGRGCGECRLDRDALAVTRRHHRGERRHAAFLQAERRR